MSTNLKEEQRAASKSKKSLLEIAAHLDIYQQFKIVCTLLHRTISSCLTEATKDLIAKYDG